VASARIERLSQDGIDALLDELVRVYAAALGEDSGAADDRLRREIFRRHREREGFRLLAACDPELVGFGYGYLGRRGQWWTERVAEALSEEEQARWLDVPHFELVELHVRPDRQGEGIGGQLLRALLDGLDTGHALLSTWETNSRALAFYERHGWRTIARGIDFGSRRGPYCVLAHELRAAG
jgi:ribosomal protein S18 acetylase RimI-like enzyme